MSHTTPPNYDSGPAPMQPRDFDIAVIGDTWNLVKDRLVDYGFMGLIIVGVAFLANFAYSLATIGFSLEAFQGPALFTTSYFVDWVVQLIGYGVVGVVSGGVTLYAIKHARGENPTLSNFSEGMRNVGPLFIAGMVVDFLTTLGTVLCCLPGLAIGGLTTFVVPLIVDRNRGPFEAFSESWQMISNQWLKAALLYLVVGIIAVLGLLACGVGIFITVPLLYATFAVLYVRFTNQHAAYASPSPYPRGGGEYGHNIGEPPSAISEGAPPKPEDFS